MVVAGGGGSRFGARKQFEVLAGRSVLDWSIDALTRVCRGVVVVLPPDDLDRPALPPDVIAVPGGDTRSASVRAGLASVGDGASHVLIHDAARPLVPTVVVDRVVAALAAGAAAAVPVVPVTDTLRLRGGRAVDRSTLVAVQTPQGFELELLRLAHERAETATDDTTLVDDLGVDVVQVEGDPVNLKITGPDDLRIAEVLLHGC